MFVTASVVAISSGLLSGCGGSGSTEATGDAVVKVTYGGAPVTEGRVDLSNPETGKGGGALLDSSGTATISGVAPGTYTATVLPPPPANPAPVPGQAPQPLPTYDNIPAIFRRPDTSPLKIEIKPGATEQTLELKQ